MSIQSSQIRPELLSWHTGSIILSQGITYYKNLVAVITAVTERYSDGDNERADRMVLGPFGAPGQMHGSGRAGWLRSGMPCSGMPHSGQGLLLDALPAIVSTPPLPASESPDALRLPYA